MSEKLTVTKRVPKAETYSSRSQLLLAKVQDFHAVFDSDPGRRVLRHLAHFCYLLRPTGGKDISSEDAARNEGRREAVLEILAVMNYDEEKILKMILNEEEAKKNPKGDLE